MIFLIKNNKANLLSLFSAFGNSISRLVSPSAALTISSLKPCVWVCLPCLNDSRAMALWFLFSIRSSSQLSASSYLHTISKGQEAVALSAKLAIVLNTEEPLSDHGLLCSIFLYFESSPPTLNLFTLNSSSHLCTPTPNAWNRHFLEHNIITITN